MSNLTREMKDISFNNSFGFRPMPGTCERCTFGRGEHADSCMERNKRIETRPAPPNPRMTSDSPRLTGKLARESNFTLALLCSKCTREHRIGGSTPEQCYQGADILGWIVYREVGKAVCPKCPAIRSAKAA